MAKEAWWNVESDVQFKDTVKRTVEESNERLHIQTTQSEVQFSDIEKVIGQIIPTVTAKNYGLEDLKTFHASM